MLAIQALEYMLNVLTGGLHSSCIIYTCVRRGGGGGGGGVLSGCLYTYVYIVALPLALPP